MGLTKGSEGSELPRSVEKRLKLTQYGPPWYTKGEGGASFFLFFLPQFSPIEKTKYRPKEFILEIGSGAFHRDYKADKVIHTTIPA